VLLFPAVTIAVLVIATNLMSDGLRQVMLPGGGRN
jgi:ABC-type dipeptide/oligopeptide/nickel transport system permease subunit